MRETDRAYGQETARRFVDLMTLMLLLFAAADGAGSDREAGFVNACADALTALCDRDGLPGGKAKLDAEDFVTRRGAAPPAPPAQKEEARPPPPAEPGEGRAGQRAARGGRCGKFRPFY